jgi:hypothetical protein
MHNSHLRTLKCAGNDMTEEFMRKRLRPAVQANSSLHKLILTDDEMVHPAPDMAIMLELQDLVAARGGAGAQQ